MRRSNVESSELSPYYQNYLSLCPDVSLDSALSTTSRSFQDILDSISEEQSMYRYAEGKWTVKELVLHMSDTERIFAYRALRFSRNDTQELPGFDENAYATESAANERTWKSIVEEFKVVRAHSSILFGSFTENQLRLSGTASNSPFSVRALGYLICGHQLHHQHVLLERYLK